MNSVVYYSNQKQKTTEEIMKIRKTTDEQGNIVVEIEVDGKWTKEMDCLLSRKLTGTTAENGSGIFGKYTNISFIFGEYDLRFRFGDILNHNDSAEKIATVLTDRIEKVKKWVAECKAKAHVETAEILTTEEVIERLQDENRLLYRNKAGQIKALDI